LGDDELPTGDPAPTGPAEPTSTGHPVADAAEGSGRGEPGAADLVDGLVPVTRVADEDEAREVARRLVERGIGASLRPAGPAAPGTGHSAGDVEVRVLPEERGRALAILGGDAGEHDSSRPAGDADDGATTSGAAGPVRPERLPVPWRSVIAIWIAALVIIPVVAGLAAYFVLSR
jgi:hypothetical protein